MNIVKHSAKLIFEKMVDYKTYGKVLLAIGSFFYLGVVIPSVSKSIMDTYIMLGTSLFFLFASILFFYRSKIQYHRLLEIEEGLEYLNRK